MENNVGLTETLNKSLMEFLLREFEDEEICFAIWYPAKGSRDILLLVKDIILPQKGDRDDMER